MELIDRTMLGSRSFAAVVGLETMSLYTFKINLDAFTASWPSTVWRTSRNELLLSYDLEEAGSCDERCAQASRISILRRPEKLAATLWRLTGRRVCDLANVELR